MATSSHKVKTRILIISDTHNRPLQSSDHAYQPFREPLPAADVLIHCGDMTMTGLMPEYHTTLDTLRAIDAPLKLVIAGNHDRTLDRHWMNTHEHIQKNEYGEARELWTGVEGRARREGVTFLDEGIHSFVLRNGARLKVYASPYTPEFYDWAFPYDKDEDRFNAAGQGLQGARPAAGGAPVPSPHEATVDVLVTHGPPYGRLDGTWTGTRAGCPHLLRAVMRARPLVHCFGHIHEGWGAEVVRWREGAAAEVAERAMTVDEWCGGGWMEGVEVGKRNGGGIVAFEPDLEKARKQRCAWVNVAEGSGKEIVRGRHTLLVNAAIVDVNYKPVNAPFLVDLDLPVVGSE
ncbi:hypothetical protein MBLNU459_g3450t1 [Dothideomycetes sp. NU459]